MELLVLTNDRRPDGVVPALSVLAHPVRSAPMTATALADAGTADVVIVDARSSPTAGRRLCRLLRAATTAPVIAVLGEDGLAAVDAQWDVDELLLPDAGPAELDVRLRLLAGRGRTVRPPEGARQTSLGELTIDDTTFAARLRGRPLELTYREFTCLAYLVEHAGRVISRTELLHEVWGCDFGGGHRTIDVHVQRLRAKLGADESLISTIRNVGYAAVIPARCHP